jgi:hypothetical protein
LHAFGACLAAIPRQCDSGSATPHWVNGWLPALDAAALYGFVAGGHPPRYVEIGSGNSTKFVRRAITDHGLSTIVTSIDPAPRAGVDELCDVVVRQPLEKADLDIFTALDAGDILFFDGSHRAFMGSDVTVFFFEILPRLRPGVLVHIHDIWLPRDYPPEWRWRHYSEQYLLAAFLLAEAAPFEVELPLSFVDADRDLRALVRPLDSVLAGSHRHPPTSFWLRTRARTEVDHPIARL